MQERASTMTDHNLEVSVETAEQAERIVLRLENEGLPVSVTHNDPADQVAVLRSEMRDEVEASVMGPGPVASFTKGMSKGLVRYTVPGAVAGALIMLLVGSMMTSAAGLIWFAAIGAMAGAALGFTAGGFLGPREHHEGRTSGLEGFTVGIHAAQGDTIARAESLVRAEDPTARVVRSDRAGLPQGPSSRDTRPVRGDTPT